MADNYDTCDTIAAVAVAVSAVLWKPKNVKKCLPERALLGARRCKTSGELGEFHRPTVQALRLDAHRFRRYSRMSLSNLQFNQSINRICRIGANSLTSRIGGATVCRLRCVSTVEKKCFKIRSKSSQSNSVAG